MKRFFFFLENSHSSPESDIDLEEVITGILGRRKACDMIVTMILFSWIARIIAVVVSIVHALEALV